ncbi:hypothetical protein E2562_037147 [Oryza meyeriana var. granulata]|uniref:Uncharacterized protein n=1 Tax=Oryza meyeriana var. granulata TaxID=110450 RepID=A0A6G1CWD3_9ORYZ|nr:hypothetical protein E2562_037147 [Oryza meyeriana var. granulata]
MCWWFSVLLISCSILPFCLLQPSEWYKSRAKVNCYPLSIKPDPISNSTTNMNSASARASHDSQAPSVQPHKCGPVDSTGGGSTVVSMALKGQQFSIPSMCSESSSRCTKSQDSVVRMRPDDTLVRRALFSDSVSGCDSVGPSLESHCHALIAPSFDSEGYASHVRMFGNSTASLHSSAPCMTTEGQVFVAPSRVYENSSSLDAEGSDAMTSSVAHQVHAPSMPPQNCARMSAAPHLCLPRSMAPHLRVLRKISKVHSTNMPEAHYSSAATMVPVICKPPVFSITPKGRDVLTSSTACTTPSYVLQVNGALRRETQRPNQGVDASNTITHAADILIALSAHREKGR